MPERPAAATRRQWLAGAVMGLGSLRGVCAAGAGPLRLVVASGPGGGADAMARAFGQQLALALQQPVLVMNAPGASGAIAARQVLRAAPDGHTLLVGSTSDLITTPLLDRQAGYSHRSFSAVAVLGGSPLMLVSPSARGWRTVDEVVAAARHAPQPLSIAVTGLTSSSALAASRFAAVARVELMQLPYPGAGPALRAVLAREVALALLPLSVVHTMALSGAVTALATLADRRLEHLPEVPSMREAGFPIEPAVDLWATLVGPPGLDPHTLRTLGEATASVLAERRYIASRLAAGEVPARPMSVPETRAFLDAQAGLYARLVQQAGTTPR